MANIFDGMKKMTDDEVRMQIALFRNVTLLNVAKETTGKVLGGLADIANSIAGSLRQRSPFDYQVVKVSDMVRQEFLRLKVNDRQQLEYELKKILWEKCKELGVTEEETTDERLSFLVLCEAAKIYDIQRYATPANKLEKIYGSYQQNFLNTIHSRLLKESKEDAIKDDQKIQDAMNRVPLETKRALQSALMPKEFSGRCIGRILRLERRTQYLAYTLDFLGYDCFDFVLSNVQTVYSAVRTLKRVSRVLCAEFVWSCRRAYGATFKVPENVLPGFVPMDERQEYVKQEKEFRGSLKGRLENERIYNQKEANLAKCEDKLTQAQEKLELLQREYDECQMEFMGLESQKDDFMSGKKPEEETKTYYNNVNDTKRKLDRAEADVKRQKAVLREAEDKKETAVKDVYIARQNLDEMKRKTDAQVHSRATALEHTWTAFYFRFAIEEHLFERIVIELTKDEQRELEEMLKELHESKDTAAFAYETEKEEDGENKRSITYVHTSTGKTIRIVYQKIKLLQIEVQA